MQNNQGENHIRFFVKDSGIGIPKDRLDAIFDRFVQADIEDRRALQGAGLELSISKSYADIMGCKLSLKSVFGEGSTFYFQIPLKAD